MEYNCKICSSSFESYESLRKHSSRVHKVHSNQCYVDFYLNGVWPTCKCGCNERIDPQCRDEKMHVTDPDHCFWKQSYKRGHVSRIKNNWGHNAIAVKKSHETQKKMYESGELKVWNKGLKNVQIPWNVGLTKSTDKRIEQQAEHLRQKWNGSFSPRHKQNLSIAHKTSLKAKIAQQINIQKANKVTAYRNNKLEQFFLNKYQLNTNWLRQQYIGKHIVDIVNHKLKKVIEVYGDYWHCNPKGMRFNWLAENINPRIKMTASQKWQKDKERIEDIEKQGYSVLVVWETDLKQDQNTQQITDFINDSLLYDNPI